MFIITLKIYINFARTDEYFEIKKIIEKVYKLI